MLPGATKLQNYQTVFLPVLLAANQCPGFDKPGSSFFKFVPTKPENPVMERIIEFEGLCLFQK